MSAAKNKKEKRVSTRSKKTEPKKIIQPVKVAWAFIIAAVGFLLYVNTIGHDYALDDSGAITQNRFVQEGLKGIPKLLTVDFWHFSNVHLAYYRPLSLITFAIEYQFSQDNPHLSHFINILFFAFSGFMLFMVLNKFFRGINPVFAFLISILFIAHPIHTEIVANIKGRDEILSFLNTMLMIWFSLKYVDTKKIKHLALSLIFCYLAMLSKETALTGVLLLPVFLFYYNDFTIKESLKKSAPFFLILVLFFIQKNYLLGTLSGIIPDDVVNYPYTESKIKLPTTFMLFAFCIRLLLIPHPLRYDYSFNQMPAVDVLNGWAWLGIILFFGGAILAFKQGLMKTVWGFALSIFYITLIPSLAFTILRGGIFAERFLFFPSLGLCIALVFGVAHFMKINHTTNEIAPLTWIKNNGKFILPLGIVFILYSFKTIDRNKAWKDNFTLFKTDIKTGKNSAQNQRHLGNQYIHLASLHNDSLKEYKDSIRKFNLIADTATINRLTQKKQEFTEQGIKALKQSLRIHPKFGESFYQIGLAYQILTPNNDSSIYYYNQAIKTAPGYAYSYYNLGIVYQTIGKNNVASYYYNEAIKYNPQYLEPKQAASSLKERGIDVHINPLTTFVDTTTANKNGTYYYELGNYHASQSDYNAAAQSFLKSIELDPRFEGAYINLANCYGMLKQYDQSLAISNKLLQLNPKNKLALKNIAVMYNMMGNKEKSDEYLQKVKAIP